MPDHPAYQYGDSLGSWDDGQPIWAPLGGGSSWPPFGTQLSCWWPPGFPGVGPGFPDRGLPVLQVHLLEVLQALDVLLDPGSGPPGHPDGGLL